MGAAGGPGVCAGAGRAGAIEGARLTSCTPAECCPVGTGGEEGPDEAPEAADAAEARGPEPVARLNPAAAATAAAAAAAEAATEGGTVVMVPELPPLTTAALPPLIGVAAPAWVNVASVTDGGPCNEPRGAGSAENWKCGWPKQGGPPCCGCCDAAGGG